MPALKTFPADLFPADSDLTFDVETVHKGDLYEIWEVSSDSPRARLRSSAQPEQHARRIAAEWTDEQVETYLMERRGPIKPKVVRKFVAVKVETTRTLATD
jgi:hypothetical protein